MILHQLRVRRGRAFLGGKVRGKKCAKDVGKKKQKGASWRRQKTRWDFLRKAMERGGMIKR